MTNGVMRKLLTDTKDDLADLIQRYADSSTPERNDPAWFLFLLEGVLDNLNTLDSATVNIEYVH